MIKWFNEISMSDIDLVGGKNASLGELYQNMNDFGINVPNGFAITTLSYDLFVEHNNLSEFIDENLNKLNNNYNLTNLGRIGISIRNKILDGDFPEDLEKSIIESYKTLSNQYLDTDGKPQNNTDVAVRSSGTAEDLPDASFAGQQETYLNVRNTKELLLSIKRCFARYMGVRWICYVRFWRRFRYF